MQSVIDWLVVVVLMKVEVLLLVAFPDSTSGTTKCVGVVSKNSGNVNEIAADCTTAEPWHAAGVGGCEGDQSQL